MRYLFSSLSVAFTSTSFVFEISSYPNTMRTPLNIAIDTFQQIPPGIFNRKDSF